MVKGRGENTGWGGGGGGGGGGKKGEMGSMGRTREKVRAGENRGRRGRGVKVGRGMMNLLNFTVLSGAHSPQGECTVTRRIREINNKGPT